MEYSPADNLMARRGRASFSEQRASGPPPAWRGSHFWKKVRLRDYGTNSIPHCVRERCSMLLTVSVPGLDPPSYPIEARQVGIPRRIPRGAEVFRAWRLPSIERGNPDACVQSCSPRSIGILLGFHGGVR
jgi:hypothetical protein